MVPAPATRVVLVVALVSAGWVAGCASDEVERAEDPYQINGSFTENATPEDGRPLSQELEKYKAQTVVLNSTPPVYFIRHFAQEHCDEVRSILESKRYVATIGSCEPIEPAGDGNASTSNRSNGTNGSNGS